MKKNFNRRSSYGHHGSKRRELAQRAHSCGLHAFTHTFTSTQLQPTTLCETPAQLLEILEYGMFILKVPEGGEANPSTWRKKPGQPGR